MRAKTRLVLYVLGLLALAGRALWPCTIAVISGKATPDGRPMIWKNRDTDVLNNKVLYVTSGKYPFLGLFNADDNRGENAWAGVNAAGFVIMNSLSVDLGETSQSGDENGTFMSRALAECATVRDFERLLEMTNGKRDTAANFGVMDAEGRACLFETGRRSSVKFDAADPRVAPQGYILRTNFALTAAKRPRKICTCRCLRIFFMVLGIFGGVIRGLGLLGLRPGQGDREPEQEPQDEQQRHQDDLGQVKAPEEHAEGNVLVVLDDDHGKQS